MDGWVNVEVDGYMDALLDLLDYLMVGGYIDRNNEEEETIKTRRKKKKRNRKAFTN